MKARASTIFIFATAIGVLATFAAPWLELRGTYAAWRVIEWHTFWRGDGAFLLANVVSANVNVPIEFATTAMPATMREVMWLGGALGAWHGLALIGLLAVGARMRLRAGASRLRVTLEILTLVVVNVLLVFALAWLLALPSSLTPKVDFRAGADLHTNSLIWSSVTWLPLAPMLAVLAWVGQLIALFQRLR